MPDQKPTSFNIIKHRGSPTSAVTASGHTVTKQEFVIIPSPYNPDELTTVQCADYHDEHFVYIDPMMYAELEADSPERYWFAMCTCGSPAIIVGGADVSDHEGHNWIQEILSRGGKNVLNMLVCNHYYTKLMENGHGWHQGQSGRQWR